MYGFFYTDIHNHHESNIIRVVVTQLQQITHDRCHPSHTRAACEMNAGTDDLNL